MPVPGNLGQLAESVVVISEELVEQSPEVRSSRAGDLTARSLIERERHVLAQIAAGKPLGQVLEDLLLAVEAQAGHPMRTSVLFLSVDGRHLRHGAAPSLPTAYNAAIDGIEVGEGVGSCGTVASRGTAVYAADIESDPLWTNFRDLALGHGLRACWSTPIQASGGEMLGTFAIYYGEPRTPTPGDVDMIATVTQTAALAIERYRSEAALRASEARLRMAIEAGRIGEWELDLASNVSVRALRHDQIFGYGEPVPAWGVETFLDHVLPEDRDGVEKAFERSAETGAGWDFQCRIRRAGDGQTRWIAAYSTPQTDAFGRTVKLFGMVQDITEQKLAEASLRDLNDRLEQEVAERTSQLRLYGEIIQSSTTAICAFDTELRLIAFNQAHSDEFHRVFGRRVQLGQRYPDLFPPE